MLDFSILYFTILLISFASLLGVDKKVCFVTCMLILGFLAALRGPQIGNDTHEYIRIFEQISSNDVENTRYELGYLWLNFLLESISDNYQIIFIVTSIFIYYSFGRFFWKYSHYPLLSVILFISYGFYSFTFTAIRQGLAMAILLYSFDCILKGKFWKFLTITIIASLFHSTAILFIIGYCIRFIKPSWKTFIIFGTGGLLGLFIFSTLLNYAFQLFPIYSTYANESYVGNAGLANILYLSISSFILIISFIILKNGKITITDMYSTGMVLLAVIIYILSLKANILDRIALYFNIYSIILLPNSLKKIPAISRVPATFFILFFFYMYSIIILMYRPGWNSVFPYSLCW